MAKFLRRINILFLAIFVFLATALSSCSKGDGIASWKQIQDKISYINERSFSLLGYYGDPVLDGYYISGGATAGTGWIFDRDIKADNEFTYYIGTNRHVAQGFQDLKDECDIYGDVFHFAMHYNLDVNYNSHTKLDDYYEIKFDPVYNGNEKPYFSRLEDGSEMWGSTSIDFSILRVDLSGWASKNTDIRKRLVSLNALGDHKITHFLDNPYKKPELSKHRFFAYGFPGDAGNAFVMYPTAGYGVPCDISSVDDMILFADNYGLVPIVAAFYVMTSNQMELDHGSSGSMVIDDDYNIVGIYWGGSGSSPNEFYGSVDILKTGDLEGELHYDVIQEFYDVIGWHKGVDY